MNDLTVVAIGLFLGVLTRTMLPYLKKWKEARDTNQPAPLFSLLYVETAVFSLVVSFVATMFLLPNISIPAGTSGLFVFQLGYTGGFTANALVNEIVS